MTFILINFFIGFAVSFLGSIPPGSINLRIITIVIERNLRAGVLFALGASLAELIYGSIAIFFSTYLTQNPSIKHWITVFSIPVLAGLGIQSWLMSRRFDAAAGPAAEIPARKFNSFFLYGFFLGIINPLNIPFWLLWTTTLLSRGAISGETTAMVFYVAGIVLGGFSLLYTISSISLRAQKRFNFNPKRANQLIGAILIGLATINLFNVLTN